MISPTDATMIDDRDAYPIDECVAKMLGWMQGSVRLEKIVFDERGILPEILPHISRLFYTLDGHLDQLKERARLELFDAADAYGDAVDGTPEKDALGNIIDQKYIVIDEYAELIKKAHFYKSEVRKELNKEVSQLKIDHIEKDEGVADLIYIKLDSLDDWAKRYGVNIIDIPKSVSVSALKPIEQLLDESKAWLIPDPRDPAPGQPWYIAARYFARECIREQPNLSNNRNLLAIKIEKKLKENGVYKRGGKKTPSIGTILKALSNIGIK